MHRRIFANRPPTKLRVRSLVLCDLSPLKNRASSTNTHRVYHGASSMPAITMVNIRRSCQPQHRSLVKVTPTCLPDQILVSKPQRASGSYTHASLASQRDRNHLQTYGSSDVSQCSLPLVDHITRSSDPLKPPQGPVKQA